MREMMLAAPLKGIEQFVVSDDPVAYEEWFAKQPKVPFGHVDVPESYKADIERVTRHNPPWARGEYLGYYRPPVPAHLFAADRAAAGGAAARSGAGRPGGPGRAVAGRACGPGSPGCSTGRSRGCRRSWTWPRRSVPSAGRTGRPIAAASTCSGCAGALQGTVIDARTLHWLGGKEIERECRAGRAVPEA